MANLTLKLITNATGPQDMSCQFGPQGGTIGRSDSCFWKLHDPDMYISSNHALISYSNGQYFITDTSTNGVYINTTDRLLGKGNQCVLNSQDVIMIGEYQILVDELSVDASAGGSDLLGLVSGSGASSSPSQRGLDNLDPLALLGGEPAPTNSEQDSLNYDSGLGLNDIINSPPPAAAPFEPNVASNGFASSPSEPAPFSPEPAPFSPSPEPAPFSNDAAAAGIPQDWELSGIMPAVKPFAPSEQKAAEPFDLSRLDAEGSQGNTFEPKPFVSGSQEGFDAQAFEPKPFEPAPFEPRAIENSPLELQMSGDLGISDGVSPQANTHEPSILKTAPEPISHTPLPDVMVAKESKSEPLKSNAVNTHPSNDFFDELYGALGLPKEYRDSVDQSQFAQNIAEVLLSSTSGLMALLNGRSIFKQESRLSLTSIQPKSNNPIKFSIDPTDTLEMLLIKKKSGYLSAKAAYDEAIADLQMHQTAFITGLQASLTGVLAELEPEKIEAEVNAAGSGFMGLKQSSKSWQTYKDKQHELNLKVKQNLNQVLHEFFAEAYEAQINNLKQNKK